jgi:hypothetical protein
MYDLPAVSAAYRKPRTGKFSATEHGLGRPKAETHGSNSAQGTRARVRSQQPRPGLHAHHGLRIFRNGLEVSAESINFERRTRRNPGALQSAGAAAISRSAQPIATSERPGFNSRQGQGLASSRHARQSSLSQGYSGDDVKVTTHCVQCTD